MTDMTTDTEKQNRAIALETEFIKRELAPLIGGTITAVDAIPSDNWGFAEVWPVLIVTKPDGTSYQVEVSEDPEGNGPGFLFIAPLSGK